MRPPRPARLLLVIMATGAFPCPAQPLTDMELQRHADSTDLLVRFRGPVHEPLRVRVQRSSDLRSWENIGAVFHFEPDDRQSMTLQSPDAGPQGFYRAFVRPEPELLATEPEDVLGYAGEFEDALAAVGDMTLPEFAARFDTAVEFLPEVTWDVTTAEYYDEFTRPPDPPVKWNGYGVPIPLPDYSLAPRETEFFQRNGFVVSERLATNSFARVYHGIYLRDLPVLVTSDSILHAWHRSYDTMLSQFEEAYLYDTLQRLLDGLAAEVPEAWADYGTGPLGESIRDADYFVAVARSLLSDAQEHTTTGHDVLVAQTLAAIEAGDMIYFNLFGRMASNPENPRNIVDFSLFKVRGHYVDSPRLQRYFQAVTWCGHIDLRVAGNPEEASPRELGTALVLHDLAQRAGVLARWRDIDTVIRTFVGPPDSMDLDQLARFLEAEGIESPGEIATLADLESLQERLGDTSLGRQLINAHSYAPMAGDQMRLPRSFTLLG
ncbi:MAG: DUF3160 domain-containing protein [Verrucomicrobiales bacterium]|nr:DUF3160 domain-containing protein [Verrucomicrobiales bacterium]